MAEIDLADAAKHYTDRTGKTFDTVAFRKFATGSYVRVLLERHGHNLLIQFGHANPGTEDVVLWTWEEMLVPADAAWMLCDLAGASAKASLNTDACIKQVTDARLSLEGRVVGLAEELKALKDKADAA